MKRRWSWVVCSAGVFKFTSNDFCQTNCLNIYQTNIHEICTIGTTWAADERSEVSSMIPRGTLPWQPILWPKSTQNPHTYYTSNAWAQRHTTSRNVLFLGLWVQLLQAAGRRQTNYLIRWMQANQLTDQLTIITGGEGHSRVGHSQACLASSTQLYGLSLPWGLW